MFSFIMNHQTDFQCGCTILYSCQQYMHNLVSPYPHQHLLLSPCLTLAILIVMYGSHCVSIWISLMANDVKHFLHVLMALINYLFIFFGKLSVHNFVHFLIEWFGFLTFEFKSSTYILDSGSLLSMWFHIFCSSL